MKRVIALVVLALLASSLTVPVAAQSGANATATPEPDSGLSCDQPVTEDGSVRVCEVEETGGSVTVTVVADQAAAVTVTDGLAWTSEDRYRPPTKVVRDEPVNITTSLTTHRGMAGVLVESDGYQWSQIIRQETTLPGEPGPLDAPSAAGGVIVAICLVTAIAFAFYRYHVGGVTHEF